jgi:hypothetical protein
MGLAVVFGGVGRVAGVGEADETDEGAVVGADKVDDDQEEPIDGDIVGALAPVSVPVSDGECNIYVLDFCNHDGHLRKNKTRKGDRLIKSREQRPRISFSVTGGPSMWWGEMERSVVK